MSITSSLILFAILITATFLIGIATALAAKYTIGDNYAKTINDSFASDFKNLFFNAPIYIVAHFLHNANIFPKIALIVIAIIGIIYVVGGVQAILSYLFSFFTFLSRDVRPETREEWKEIIIFQLCWLVKVVVDILSVLAITYLTYLIIF